MPELAASHVPAKAEGADEQVGQTSARGHIGLIVLGSIAVGLGVGLVLDLLVSGGGREPVITGFALLSLAIGCATLAQLSARRTNQPQDWARLPAISFGVSGAAILILRPSGHVLGLLGWVWPILLLVVVVWMVRGSRRSLHNWSRRALLYPAFVLLALIALGGVFETVTEAATSNNPPLGGRTYAVNGHSLYLRCTGSGSPAVILFNGLGERTPSWAWVQGDVARQTRVCAFDRAGHGWSGPGPAEQDAHQLAADVHGLLTAAKVPGPYVVAGHSAGGTYALAYAMDYPKDVAGIALIDSASPYQFDLPSYPAFYSLWRRASALLPTLARAGVARLYSLGMGFSSLPPDARRQARAFSSSPREMRADRDEFAILRTVFRQDQALKSLGAKPLFVLTADVRQQSGWPAAQNKLATLSTNVIRKTAHTAHAALVEDRQYAAVTGRAIEAVVRSVRTSAPLAASHNANMTTALGASPTTTLKVPATTGAFHVGTRSMALTDRARSEPEAPKQPRSLVIQLWYPAAAGTRSAPYMPSAVARYLAGSAGVQPALLESVKLDALADVAPLPRKGGWPIVLFSPGFGVERQLYTGLVEDLASHGYVVVAIDHPHDASIVEFPDGHVVRPRSQMNIINALSVRVADTRFVLTELARLDRAGV